MVYLLLHMAHDLFGDDFLERAWQEYTSVSRAPVPLAEGPEAETCFLLWTVFDYVPRSENSETGGQPKLPVAVSFLLVANDELDPLEKELILEVSEQPYSFWSVQEIEPGQSVKLKDIFTHTERTVKELQASQVLAKGDIVYTRVVSLGNTVIMVGMAPYLFPPGYYFDFLEAREILFGSRKDHAAGFVHLRASFATALFCAAAPPAESSYASAAKHRRRSAGVRQAHLPA